MDTKFTPGPWYVTERGETWVHVGTTENASLVEVIGDSNREDADLIAAAPDMYAALKSALFLADSLWNLQGNEYVLDYAVRIRAALDKADGK